MNLVYIFLLSILNNVKVGNPYFLELNLWNECDCMTCKYHAAGIISAGFWQLPLIYPVESVMIGLSLCIIAYYLIIQNEQSLACEKSQLAYSMLDKAQTSLIMMRNHLEEVAATNISGRTSNKLQQVLEYNNHVIDCFQNITTLNKIKRNNVSELSITELELYAYIISIVRQCRTYAKAHNVQLKIKKVSDYANCRVSEAIMTAALQHLLYRMIEITTPYNCINITISHFTDYWKLCISNCAEPEEDIKGFISSVTALLSAHSHGNLRMVRKIIRLHGGKVICINRSDTLTFKIIVPINHHSPAFMLPKVKFSITKEKLCSDDKSVADGAGQPRKVNKSPRVLLVMTDKVLSDYLYRTLSEHLQITVLEEPEQVFRISGSENPDLIIIDEMINGVEGDELCYKIKSDKAIAGIPLILLINSDDNESYLSHVHSKADKLELRMINICKLKADINMLIENHLARRERIKQLLVNSVHAVLPEVTKNEDESPSFIDRIRSFLEKNLSTEGYTVDMLCTDMGMCRTALYSKMKEVTGKPPTDYMLSFKMDRAKELLITQKYSITEIATILGYCDAKYFGRKFKDYYHVCPTKYLNGITR